MTRKMWTLSEFVRNEKEHQELVSRGYVTCYTGMFMAEGVKDLRFGYQETSKECGHYDGLHDFPINFTIEGLPPAQGTRLWLQVVGPSCGCIPSSTRAFRYLEEAVMVSDEVFDDFNPDDLEKARKEVRDNHHVNLNDVRVWVVHVQLP